VVYGASGYTGRLICEYLREYNVPFIAAGRDESRLKVLGLACDGLVALIGLRLIRQLITGLVV